MGGGGRLGGSVGGGGVQVGIRVPETRRRAPPPFVLPSHAPPSPAPSRPRNATPFCAELSETWSHNAGRRSDQRGGKQLQVQRANTRGGGGVAMAESRGKCAP